MFARSRGVGKFFCKRLKQFQLPTISQEQARRVERVTALGRQGWVDVEIGRGAMMVRVGGWVSASVEMEERCGSGAGRGGWAIWGELRKQGCRWGGAGSRVSIKGVRKRLW